MKYAYIENNIVTNIILWDGVVEYNPGILVTLVQSDIARIGDTYDNGLFKYLEDDIWKTRE